MAERKRSSDGSRDTDAFLSEEDRGGVSQQGRAGGNVARAIGSEDDRKRAGGGVGATRKRKADEDRPGTSNLGDENR